MKTAKFSGCGRYRYWLTRPTDDLFTALPPVAFIMLNPSTADIENDDPTIRRCINFATSWGASGLVVANLYAYRTPKPIALLKAPDPVGPRNSFWLSYILDNFKTVVCGWGEHAKIQQVDSFTEMSCRSRRKLMCLGINKSGMPKHPLYVKATQKPSLWLNIKKG
ncbi:DUF1643 domain-containing protein [Aliikangiella marina]|uniref:DUF1643 domain-containing protein n=1 Tax=Aliikangiella marina TaxID=1712262 RepID=A0A545TK76_9GAMM|nr:DUF1643 domain-containing protein [Aliikangiella marina]